MTRCDGVSRASVPPPTIGWRRTSGRMTARLKEFYDAFCPNNATAMVIGDFEQAEALGDRACLRPDSLRHPDSAVHTVEPRRGGALWPPFGGPDRWRGALCPGGSSRRGTPTRMPWRFRQCALEAARQRRLYQALVGPACRCNRRPVAASGSGAVLRAAPVRPGVDRRRSKGHSARSSLGRQRWRIEAEVEGASDRSRGDLRPRSTDQIAASPRGDRRRGLAVVCGLSGSDPACSRKTSSASPALHFRTRVTEPRSCRRASGGPAGEGRREDSSDEGE